MNSKSAIELLLAIFAVYFTVCAVGRKDRLDRKVDMQGGIVFFILLIVAMMIM